MTENIKIEFVPRAKINLALWDECVQNSPGGSVFAYSWYLDYMCDSWNALIYGNYEYIMPLPESKKWWVIFSKMPYSVKYLGIIGCQKNLPEINKKFCDAIPKHYKLCNHTFNKCLTVTSPADSYLVTPKRAIEIDLILPYNRIFRQYNAELKQKLEQPDSNNFNLVSGVQLIDLLQLFNQNPLSGNASVTLTLLKRFRKLGIHALREKCAEIVGAYDSQNKLWAAIMFVSSHNKVFPVFAAQLKQSPKFNVYELLLDYFIKKHTEKNLTLCMFDDCIKNFSPAVFGGMQASYQCFSRNTLPLILKTPIENHMCSKI